MSSTNAAVAATFAATIASSLATAKGKASQTASSTAAPCPSTENALDWYMYEAMGVPVLLLQAGVLFLLVRALWSTFNLAKEWLKEIDEVCKAMENIPSLTTATLWYPKNVAVIASVYKISVDEVENEYRKDGNGKNKVVTTVFEDNQLTRMLLTAPSNTRFMSAGYDFQPQVVAGGLPSVGPSASATGIKPVAAPSASGTNLNDKPKK